jgi:hypothetical protein
MRSGGLRWSLTPARGGRNVVPPDGVSFDRRLHAPEDDVRRRGGVHDLVPIRPPPDLFEVALPHAAVELDAPLLDAVEHRRKAFCGNGLVHVEDHRQIRHQTLGGDLADGGDGVGSESARGALIGQGRTDEPVGDHGPTRGEGGPDPLPAELGPTGHVEQHLAAEIHLRTGRIEQHVPNPLADRGATGLADRDGDRADRPQPLREKGQLRALAAPIRSVEDEKAASEAVSVDGHGERLAQGVPVGRVSPRGGSGSRRLPGSSGPRNRAAFATGIPGGEPIPAQCPWARPLGVERVPTGSRAETASMDGPHPM